MLARGGKRLDQLPPPATACAPPAQQEPRVLERAEDPEYGDSNGLLLLLLLLLLLGAMASSSSGRSGGSSSSGGSSGSSVRVLRPVQPHLPRHPVCEDIASEWARRPVTSRLAED
jgi:hypothetical protein